MGELRVGATHEQHAVAVAAGDDAVQLDRQVELVGTDVRQRLDRRAQIADPRQLVEDRHVVDEEEGVGVELGTIAVGLLRRRGQPVQRAEAVAAEAVGDVGAEVQLGALDTPVVGQPGHEQADRIGDVGARRLDHLRCRHHRAAPFPRAGFSTSTLAPICTHGSAVIHRLTSDVATR